MLFFKNLKINGAKKVDWLLLNRSRFLHEPRLLVSAIGKAYPARELDHLKRIITQLHISFISSPKWDEFANTSTRNAENCAYWWIPKYRFLVETEMTVTTPGVLGVISVKKWWARLGLNQWPLRCQRRVRSQQSEKSLYLVVSCLPFLNILFNLLLPKVCKKFAKIILDSNLPLKR